MSAADLSPRRSYAEVARSACRPQHVSRIGNRGRDLGCGAVAEGEAVEEHAPASGVEDQGRSSRRERLSSGRDENESRGSGSGREALLSCQTARSGGRDEGDGEPGGGGGDRGRRAPVGRLERARTAIVTFGKFVGPGFMVAVAYSKFAFVSFRLR